MSLPHCSLFILAALLHAALAVYVIPDIHLQARSSGGIKAFLQDSCGVEGFGFQVKAKNETSWKTGNGTKESGFWTFLDKSTEANPGDEYQYRARVWHQGAKYSTAIISWMVPELVNEFSFPPVVASEDNCISEEEESKEENSSIKQLPPVTVRQPKKLSSPVTTTTSEPTTTEAATTSESSEHKGRVISAETADQSVQSEDQTGPAFSLTCEWKGTSSPAQSKEEALERQLSVLQCEMASFLERTTKLTAELNRELLDLKKLNYATVARMQRLEALIRTIPRAVPYSFI